MKARTRLIAALEGSLPPDFKWNTDYWRIRIDEAHADPDDGWHGTMGCACGLAEHIGIVNTIFPGGRKQPGPWTIVGRAIGLHPNTAMRIFAPLIPQKVYGVEKKSVTPQMVAAKLREAS